MVVYLGELQLLIGENAQFIQCPFHIQLAALHL
jgi:hypothetical protein